MHEFVSLGVQLDGVKCVAIVNVTFVAIRLGEWYAGCVWMFAGVSRSWLTLSTLHGELSSNPSICFAPSAGFFHPWSFLSPKTDIYSSSLHLLMRRTCYSIWIWLSCWLLIKSWVFRNNTNEKLFENDRWGRCAHRCVRKWRCRVPHHTLPMSRLLKRRSGVCSDVKQ